MANVTLRVRMDTRKLQRTIRSAPADVRRDFRATARREVTAPVANRMKVAGFGTGYYAARISARSTIAWSGDIPVIKAGGSAPAGVSGGATMGQLVAGGEFGSRYYRQFRPRRTGGYWFFRSFEREAPRAMQKWTGLWATVSRKWRLSGG